MKRDFIRIAFFTDERKAALFQARLEEEGIPSFLSNAHANALIPQLGGGVGIHINKEDLELSKEILANFQRLQDNDESVFTHHEATHEDIEYEKGIHKPKKSAALLPLIAIFLLILFVLRYVAKSKGILPQIFEPF